MRLLLDAHIPPAVARALQRDGIDAVALRDWLDGAFRTAADDDLLAGALEDRRVLVSFDCRTLPPLLRELAETGQHHGGVILVDERTLRPNDVGGLQRALRQLVEQSCAADWQDVAVFLRAGGERAGG